MPSPTAQPSRPAVMASQPRRMQPRADQAAHPAQPAANRMPTSEPMSSTVLVANGPPHLCHNQNPIIVITPKYTPATRKSMRADNPERPAAKAARPSSIAPPPTADQLEPATNRGQSLTMSNF